MSKRGSEKYFKLQNKTNKRSHNLQLICQLKQQVLVKVHENCHHQKSQLNPLVHNFLGRYQQPLVWVTFDPCVFPTNTEEGQVSVWIHKSFFQSGNEQIKMQSVK